MGINLMINMAVHVPSNYSNSFLLKFIQNVENTFCRIPYIRKVVIRRCVKDKIGFIDCSKGFNRISPQIECFANILKIQQNISERLLNNTYKIGWLWQQTINQAFNIYPYPEYVLHYPVDVVWKNKSNGKLCNDVIAENTMRGFIGNLLKKPNIDLLIGSFKAFDTNTPAEEHPKNEIEDKINKKLRDAISEKMNDLKQFQRPRSEFFIIKRSFFYDFIGLIDIAKHKKIFDDPTIQFLLYALSKSKTVYEYDLGGYYIPLKKYDKKIRKKQIERVGKILNWAKKM